MLWYTQYGPTPRGASVLQERLYLLQHHHVSSCSAGSFGGKTWREAVRVGVFFRYFPTSFFWLCLKRTLKFSGSQKNWLKKTPLGAYIFRATHDDGRRMFCFNCWSFCSQQWLFGFGGWLKLFRFYDPVQSANALCFNVVLLFHLCGNNYCY